MNASPRAFALAGLGAGVLAIAGAGVIVHADAGTSACRAATAEKLGVPFVHLCARGSPSPVWISGPLPCGQGAHASVACPTATALGAGAGGLNDSNVSHGPYAVAMTDAFTAYRLCGMRFGGRLPTRLEREQARDRLGLATLLATEGADGSGEIALSELPEWVADGDCENPSLPGPKCRIATYPPAPLPLRLAWEAVRACEARPLAEAGEHEGVATLGQICIAEAAESATAREIHALHSPAVRSCLFAGPSSEPSGYELRCTKPPTRPHPALQREPLAAVRCLLREDSLLSRCARSTAPAGALCALREVL